MEVGTGVQVFECSGCGRLWVGLAQLIEKGGRLWARAAIPSRLYTMQSAAQELSGRECCEVNNEENHAPRLFDGKLGGWATCKGHVERVQRPEVLAAYELGGRKAAELMADCQLRDRKRATLEAARKL